MSQCMFLKTFTQTCIHIFRLMFSNNKRCQKVKLNWMFFLKSNIFVIHFNLKKNEKAIIAFIYLPDATTVLAQRVFSMLRLSWICGSVSSCK